MEFKDKVDRSITEDLIRLYKTRRTKEMETDNVLLTTNEDDFDCCECVPKNGPYILNTSGRLYIDDFIGSKANDGTAFALGSRNSGTRLVLNYKGISALLLTKYGNFDLGAFDVSDNVTELEFNGVLFKRVEENKGE